MKRRIFSVAVMVLFLSAVLLSSSAWAGRKQHHRWEGVAIGVGATILGSALLNSHVYAPPTAVYHEPAPVDVRPRVVYHAPVVSPPVYEYDRPRYYQRPRCDNPCRPRHYRRPQHHYHRHYHHHEHYHHHDHHHHHHHKRGWGHYR